MSINSTMADAIYCGICWHATPSPEGDRYRHCTLWAHGRQDELDLAVRGPLRYGRGVTDPRFLVPANDLCALFEKDAIHD